MGLSVNTLIVEAIHINKFNNRSTVQWYLSKLRLVDSNLSLDSSRASLSVTAQNSKINPCIKSGTYTDRNSLDTFDI